MSSIPMAGATFVKRAADSATPADTVFAQTWTPTTAGTTTWRAVWRGGGGAGTSPTVDVVTR